MNKKTKLSYVGICSLLLSQATFAGIVGVRTSGSGSGTSVSGQTNANTTVTPGKTNNEKVDKVEGTASATCKQDPDASTYFPLDFFQQISRDGSSLTFEQRADNKILVKMPASIDSCGKFKPQLVQDPKTKSVTVMMQLESGNTYAWYLDCLSKEKIKVGDVETTILSKDGKIDHDKIPGKNYSEYSYVLDYSFEKDKDIKKTLKLSYGFPKAFSGKDGYPSTYGIDSDVELPSSLCMSAEKIQPQITYLNKGQDVMIAELKEICKSGDAQRIAEARKSIGNADALKDIADRIKSELDAGYLVAVKADVKRISDSMDAIEKKLSTQKDSIDEATAKKLTGQYADLTKELDSKFLNPAIYRLDNLMKQRADLSDDDSRLKGIDEEIKKINDNVGEFSRRPNSAVSSVYTVMEKFALTDSAKTIEDIRLKSYLYGKVYGGPTDEKRGKPLSFEEANQKQVAGMQKFDRVMTDWTDQYLVGKGNTYPIQKTERERTGAIDKMNKRWYDYQTTEQKNYQKYCSIGMTGSVVNPIQCQAWTSGIEQRRNSELKKRETDLNYIRGRDSKLAKMGTNYNGYQKRKVAEETRDSSGGNEPYASSYSSFEDNFADQYPLYNGPQQNTAFNPNMFQMGIGQQAMNMGNTGMYNPQMVNPQMPVQPGQYQMPQMNQQYMQGGQMPWPQI
jgi:hypothetical protein